VLHSGTARDRNTGSLVTAGGRVLSVVGEGATLEAARAEANAGLAKIHFRGMQARSDIGHQGAPKRIAVLFSGRGSNMDALFASMHAGILTGFAVPVLAVTNQPDAAGISIAKRYEVKMLVLPSKDCERAAYDHALVLALREAAVDYVLLAGFMRILSAEVVEAFPKRILNVHPADTAKHQGLHGYAWALENKLAHTHVTVHFVEEGLDTGQVILKAPVDLEGATSLRDVEARGLLVEHATYASALLRVLLMENSQSCAEF
jgi:phosphoribosylglycinamide formyltransferase 1